MSQHASPKPTPLTSWPPSPSLLRIHILTRSILLLTDTIGFSLLLAVGIGANKACAIVAGSFLCGSLIITPFIMLWNRGLLKRINKAKTNGQYQQLDNADAEDHMPRFRVGGLKVVTFLEAFGALSFFALYPPLMAEESNEDSWSWSMGWGNRRHYYTTYSYGSVSVLISLLLHAYLFATSALQLHSASRIRTPKRIVCPHCNHTMARLSSSASSIRSCDYSTPPESSPVENQGPVETDMLGESLVDARVSVSMNAGQETGTTYKTPRVSESAARAGEAVANEDGEAEGDALINKAG